MSIVRQQIVYRNFQIGEPVTPITELLHVAYRPLAEMGLRYVATHQDDAKTEERLTTGIPFVAELQGRIIGTLTLYTSWADSESAWYREEHVCHFGQFAVLPELQGQGIGTRLIQIAEQQTRQRRATELALDTPEGATHLCRWYQRLGFRFIEYVDWDVTNYRSVILSKRLTAGDAGPSGSAD